MFLGINMFLALLRTHFNELKWVWVGPKTYLCPRTSTLLLYYTKHCEIQVIGNISDWVVSSRSVTRVAIWSASSYEANSHYLRNCFNNAATSCVFRPLHENRLSAYFSSISSRIVWKKKQHNTKLGVKYTGSFLWCVVTRGWKIFSLSGNLTQRLENFCEICNAYKGQK
jgi:hypothetical protein